MPQPPGNLRTCPGL